MFSVFLTDVDIEYNGINIKHRFHLRNSSKKMKYYLMLSYLNKLFRIQVSELFIIWARLRKSTFAVRETVVSRHDGGPFKCSSQSLQYDSAVMHRRFQGDPQLNLHDAERR